MKVLYCKFHHLINGILIITAAFAVYSNNYHHDYPLDGGHLLLDNPYVRSIKYIPQYFHDANTLTILPANIDYRPVLQTTYALNYAISKYDTWSWHLLQILLHCICALSLYFLCRKLLRAFHPETGTVGIATISLCAAMIFTVHPTGSGVINYLSARSSLLTAAFLLPSIVLYLRPKYHGNDSKIPLLPLILYTLALYTKIEAIGAMAVFVLAEPLAVAMQRAETDSKASSEKKEGFFLDIRESFTLATVKRLSLFVVITAFYLVCYRIAMSGYSQAARHAADVSSLQYLYTQITTWWHYVFNWFAPVNLIADDLNYPIFRSLFAPEVLLALSGWIVVAAVVIRLYPRFPYLPFLGISALALLSPTSSIMPLAEMVNEHRPYLPLALLSLGWLVPFLLSMFTVARTRTLAIGATTTGCMIIIASFFILTYQRNKVFADESSYYLDLIKKSPSSRSYVNYGLTLMRNARYGEALDYYKKALETAPNWHIIHINMGIVYQQFGDTAQARFHYDRAVATEEYSACALQYRAEFLLKQKQYGKALDDLQKSIPLAREYFRLYKSMACAYAGLGDGKKSLSFTKKCYDIDPAVTELEIVTIARPFWDTPSLAQPGIDYFRGIDKLYPDRWWVHQNIGDLARAAGNVALAVQSFEKAQKLRDRIATR
jgi:protein O-mannosyl-transferase